MFLLVLGFQFYRSEDRTVITDSGEGKQLKYEVYFARQPQPLWGVYSLRNSRFVGVF